MYNLDNEGMYDIAYQGWVELTVKTTCYKTLMAYCEPEDSIEVIGGDEIEIITEHPHPSHSSLNHATPPSNCPSFASSQVDVSSSLSIS